MKPTAIDNLREEKTLLGQLIAEIAKFGGTDKAKASQLATILIPHIDRYATRQADEARLEAYELLYWKYKELNDQSVDVKFVEAYNILTAEARLDNPKEEE